MKTHFLLLGFLISSVRLLNAQEAQFRYTVEVRNPKSERSYLTLEFPPFEEKTATFYMPAWAPGNYTICDFGRWIDSLQAFDSAGSPLEVHRKGINEWVIPQASALCKITYIAHDIPEDSLETLSTALSEMSHDVYYFNGPAVFGYLKNQKKQPYGVTYKLPADWRVWCGLTRSEPYSFFAEDYDQLIDCPVLAGGSRIREYPFELGSARYTMIINSELETTVDSLIYFTKQCINYQTEFFGGTPFKEYYFFFNFSMSHSRFGALEHRNSSVYSLPPPTRQSSLRNSLYTRIIAHELFHAWNPKIIYPKEFADFNYQDSIRITSMWFIEGLTEYYAKLTLVRAGVLQPQHLYESLKSIALSDTRDDLEYLSLRAAEMGVANPMYTKGALIAYFMDVLCRDKTQNKKSLDDVILYMNDKYGRNGKPYSDRKLLKIFKQATGVDFKSFYSKYIRGKEPLPVTEFFEKGGLSYEYSYPPYYGWYFDLDSQGQLFVATVSENSTASSLGMRPGDVIREIQTQKLSSDIDQIRECVQIAEKQKAGADIRFVVERGGALVELHAKVKSGTQPDVVIKENPNATEKQIRIKKSIVGSK